MHLHFMIQSSICAKFLIEQNTTTCPVLKVTSVCIQFQRQSHRGRHFFTNMTIYFVSWRTQDSENDARPMFIGCYTIRRPKLWAKLSGDARPLAACVYVWEAARLNDLLLPQTFYAPFALPVSLCLIVGSKDPWCLHSAIKCLIAAIALQVKDRHRSTCHKSINGLWFVVPLIVLSNYCNIAVIALTRNRRSLGFYGSSITAVSTALAAPRLQLFFFFILC